MITKCPGISKKECEVLIPEKRFNINVPHRFMVHTFKFFTCCDHCGSLLWGGWRQGLQCEGILQIFHLLNFNTLFKIWLKTHFSECKLNVHKRCQKNVANNCGINPKQIALLLQELTIPESQKTQLMKTPKSVSSLKQIFNTKIF